MFSWSSFATCRNPRAAASRPAPSGRGCGTLPSVFLDDRVKADPFLAILPIVGQLHARRIVGNGVLAFHDLVHLVRRDVEELRVRVNEMRDQPWTCDPIPFRLLPRHPFHTSPPIGESLGR